MIDPLRPPRTTLGDFELILLSDGTYFADGGAMFGVVPKTLWSRRVIFDELNRMTCGLNCLLVRTGKQNVLIETGIGPKVSAKMASFFQPQVKLMESFAAAGVAPEEIDIVINTHLHFDHAGWNTRIENGKVVPTFTRAKYFFQQGELEHAHEQHERDRVSYLTDNYDPLVRNGQAEVYRGDRGIVPGISVRVTPGHTRDHQIVVLESAGKKACYIGDTVPTSAHVDPAWVMAYDLYPLDTIASRRRIYAEAVREEWLIIFTHDPVVPWARIREVDGKFRPQAA